jgi:CBS domain-containing protein
MTYTQDTMRPSTSADEAAHHMALKGIGCLPVVDEAGRLQGLLSKTDVLQAFAASARGDEIGEARQAKPRDERLLEGLRGERERLARTLALHDAVGPSLAAMRLRSLGDRPNSVRVRPPQPTLPRSFATAGPDPRSASAARRR